MQFWRRWYLTIEHIVNSRVSFFIRFMAVPQPTLSQFHLPDVNHCILFKVLPVGQQESNNKFGSLTPTERSIRFEIVTFRFCNNTLTRWVTLPKCTLIFFYYYYIALQSSIMFSEFFILHIFFQYRIIMNTKGLRERYVRKTEG